MIKVIICLAAVNFMWFGHLRAEPNRLGVSGFDSGPELPRRLGAALRGQTEEIGGVYIKGRLHNEVHSPRFPDADEVQTKFEVWWSLREGGKATFLYSPSYNRWSNGAAKYFEEWKSVAFDASSVTEVVYAKGPIGQAVGFKAVQMVEWDANSFLDSAVNAGMQAILPSMLAEGGRVPIPLWRVLIEAPLEKIGVVRDGGRNTVEVSCGSDEGILDKITLDGDYRVMKRVIAYHSRDRRWIHSYVYECEGFHEGAIAIPRQIVFSLESRKGLERRARIVIDHGVGISEADIWVPSLPSGVVVDDRLLNRQFVTP